MTGRVPTGDLGHELGAGVHRLADGWYRCALSELLPHDDTCREAVEQAIGDLYRRSGLRRPGVAWCSSPGVYLSAIADPQGRADALFADRPWPIRLWRHRPRALRAATNVVVFTVGGLAALLLGITVWVVVSVLGYRLLVAVAERLGVLAVEPVLIWITLIGSGAVFWKLLPRGQTRFEQAREARRRRSWHTPLEAWDPSQDEAFLSLLPWQGLRRVAVVLAPPVELRLERVEFADGLHDLLTASWPDALVHVFLDGERVPHAPAQGEARHPVESFVQAWVGRHLPDPGAHRSGVEQAVGEVYAALGWSPPALLWCDTPAEYEAAVSDPLRHLGGLAVSGALPVGVTRAALERQRRLARPRVALGVAWGLFALQTLAISGWWMWLAAADPAIMRSTTGRVVALFVVPVLLFLTLPLTSRAFRGASAGHSWLADWARPVEDRVTEAVARTIAPRAGWSSARQQIAAVVGDADLYGNQLRRSFPPMAVGWWRWLRDVRLGVAPDEPWSRADLAGDAALGALERTVKVPWTALRRVAVLLEPPSTVHRQRLALADGDRFVRALSLDWPDGEQWHLIGGVRVPRAAGSGSWSAQEIIAVQNSEVRRVLIEMMGWSRFLVEAGLPLIAEAPDPANPPHTLRLYGLPAMEWREWDDLSVLFMTNASPGLDGTARQFAEFVPARISDPVAAAAWQYGVSEEVYRAIQRRT